MDSTHQAHALGVATGRRELAERVAAELRRSVATWRTAEAKPAGVRGAIRAAFLWSVTERWCARVEVVAASVESELAQLRTAEQGAQAAYQQALAAPPVVVEPGPKPVPKRMARGRK